MLKATLASITVVAGVAMTTTAYAQEPCPQGTLFEPYSQTCASMTDRRDWWLTPSVAIAGDPPEAGAINAGTTYLNGALTAASSSRLHTKMFVYPNGLQPSGFLDWTFTTATNRVDSAVEVVGIYRTALGNSGVLSIFGRPCSVDYPCPDGDTVNGWQPSKDFSELGCNITHLVDDGGHAQKVIHYANHTDRLDDGSPPLWKNAVYLWNYCNEEWDLIWQHNYRENKRDCSVDGCYWWGPGIELPGSQLRPQVAELGYEDALLYHDGVWSELRPDETGFRHPEDRPDLSPWQLFHLDPNRSYGVGSFLNENDAPAIVSQELITSEEDKDFEIELEDLIVEDPDVDPAYHSSYALTVFSGDNYTQTGTTIQPDTNFFGDLHIPVSVSDGAADSPTFTLLATITPVEDPPSFASSAPTEDTEASMYVYEVATIDPDGDASVIETLAIPGWLNLADHGDGSATLSGTPSGVDVGDHSVILQATDDSGLSDTQSFTISVVAAADGPIIEVLGSSPMAINQGQTFVDPGATASDVQDGDLTASITTQSNVNVQSPGTYEVVYSVSDTAGNNASATRSVLVRSVSTRSSGGGGAFSEIMLSVLLAFASFAHRPVRCKFLFFARMRAIS